METFLVGPKLKKAIEQILAERGCRCAVAFWGRGSASKLPKAGRGEFKVICNLISGGTNPFALAKIKRSNLRQSNTLHAKIYLGSRRAIVTSANVSANGLGLEGIEQAKWIEAGILTNNISKISTWFETLWKDAEEVTDRDLELAKDAWKHRQRAKPSLRSLADFDVEQKETPLLYWVSHADWEHNAQSLKKHLGSDSESTRSLIDNGIEVETSDDKAMKPGTWLIVWERRSDDKPKRRPKPYWFYTDRVIPKSFRFKNEHAWRDTVIQANLVPSFPFDLNAPHVLDAFFDVLADTRFDRIRTDDYEPPWFTPARLQLMRRFWPAFKHRYVELAGNR